MEIEMKKRVARGSLIPINRYLVADCVKSYKEEGWLISEIALAGSVCYKTLDKIISGQQKWVRKETLEKIAISFGLTPEDFISWPFHQSILSII